MALQAVHSKITRKNICGNKLVNIVTTLANEALMRILLEDPPADWLGKWWVARNVFHCFLSLLLSYFMFVFKDKIVSYKADCGIELTKENLCFFFVITPALGNLLFCALSKWILSQSFIFFWGDELMKVDSTICTDQVATASLQLRIKK